MQNQVVTNSFKSFGIAAASNAGVQYIAQSAKGPIALRVLSQWSDVFVQRQAKLERQAQNETAQLSDDDKVLAIADYETRLLACLVVEWPFDEDCTPENVADFFRVAPHVRDAVKAFTADAGNFYGA